MHYEAWRITFQSDEAAARSAFKQFQELSKGKCLHQIQEPAPVTAMDALREAEAALEVAMARILKADPGHSICVTSEAKALAAVRAALAAPAPMLVAQPQLHAALFAARGALQHMKEGGKPTQSLLNEAIAAIDSVAVTQAAPAAVAVPDAVRDAEKLLRAEAARLARIYGSNKWYGFSAEKESYLEHLRAAAALAATPAAEHATLPAELATQAAQPVLPTGWVPCVVTYEGQHPEEVAYGPQIMMDRLKKWLERYFEMKAAAPVALPEPVSDEQIKAVFLANGFTIKEGLTDLKPYVYQAARALLATGGQAQAVEQEPFGYFKAEPFGWTDCGPDDEGAVALYERPQAQADARDAEQERWMGIGKAIERACVDLPAGAEINIHLEKDAGTVTLSDCDGDEQENFPTDEGLAGVVNAAIDTAIAAAKGE